LYRKEVDRLKSQISKNIRSSAKLYHKIGFDIFHESRSRSWVNFQPAIGKLSISVELLLEAVIAKKAIAML